MRRLKSGAAVLAFTVLSICASCGGGTVKANQDCMKVGSTDECASGAICGEDHGVTMCLKICNGANDCASVEDCAPVSTTQMACKSKSSGGVAS